MLSLSRNPRGISIWARIPWGRADMVTVSDADSCASAFAA